LIGQRLVVPFQAVSVLRAAEIQQLARVNTSFHDGLKSGSTCSIKL
jgi:hypothetical protein